MPRKRLKNRREHEAFEFEAGGVPYIVGFGNFDDGGISELFMNAGKTGSAADIVARECAIVASIALQHSVLVSELSKSLPKLANGKPAGPLGIALQMATANGEKLNSEVKSSSR